MIQLFAVVYFRSISKSWVYWNYMCIGLQIGAIAGTACLPESPDFYFAKGRYEDSKAVLLWIAKFNGANLTSEQLRFSDEVVDENEIEK